MNLSVAASAAARGFAEKVAFVEAGVPHSFTAFDASVDRLASYLADRLAPGSRVAVMLKNGMPAVLLQFALARAGLVRVPVNSRYTALELQTLLNDSEAELVFYDDHTQAICGQAMRDSPNSEMFISTHSRDLRWNEALECTVRLDLLHRSALDDLASINYTSGTTGKPKGVMLSHRNWLAVFKNMLVDRDLRPTDVVAHIGPFSHAAGTYLEAWFLRGACNLLIEGTVDGLCDAIEQQGVTAFTTVPTFLTKLVNAERLKHVDCSRLRLISYGAEAISHDTLEKSWRRFGPVLWQNYGQTEAMITCVHLAPSQHLTADGLLRQGYIGQPYTFVDVVIRDSITGAPAADGQMGELTVAAEHVMSGYWNRPEETRKALRDGWLWTGDLAMRDATGLIRIVGRSKDMLICGGFNIYPQEVESVLTSTGLISEAAVVPRKDAAWGEVPVAFVTLNQDGRDADPDLAALFKPLLGIKTPKAWTVLVEMPKTKNGKIDKQQLQAIAAGEVELCSPITD